uniref:methylenetetrahydrofolate--tRNA-(uracil(54)- C(5))-methyltransferase (FADH(2)-oxidizing) TrmFO n=1 Tax=uncultured Megasphaera sp. TaxID=165188 RepID=UPI002598C619
DMTKIYRAARYNKGGADYLNCPFTKDEYEFFWKNLITAECAELHEFEKDDTVFEGCMPIEVMAGRGMETMRFGPLKPVGLPLPETQEIPYAVVQLRQDNSKGTLYNIVGFQTHLKFPEQKRVFSLIPGLEKAEFVRYGVMHRNSYINSPVVLLPTLQYKENPYLFFAGQLTGVEGYLESAAMGLLAGINAAQLYMKKDCIRFSSQTAIGGLSHYISHHPNTNFQPMNINFGIIEPLGVKKKMKKKEKNMFLAQRALQEIDTIKGKI